MFPQTVVVTDLDLVFVNADEGPINLVILWVADPEGIIR